MGSELASKLAGAGCEDAGRGAVCRAFRPGWLWLLKGCCLRWATALALRAIRSSSCTHDVGFRAQALD